jgi:hypothetical protein
MKKTVSIVISFFFALQASAQFNIEFHSGFATYSNKDLKNYQSIVATNVAYGGKTLESFPSYWYYGVDAKWNLPKALIGLSISKGVTGGQVYYSDYTGTFSEQSRLTYTAIRMLTAARFVFNNGNTSLQLDPRFGLAFGRLNVKQVIIAADENQTYNANNSYKYKAVNPFVEPTVTLTQKIGLFSVSAFVGYHLDLVQNDFRLTNSPHQSNESPMTNGNGSDVKMNLSGLRAGASVGLSLGRPKEIDFTRVYLSVGLGVDFGGIGVNAMSMVTQNLGLFGGVGYNLNKVGMSGGLRLYLSKQDSRIRPFLVGMYGYNGVFIVKGRHDLDKTFYGPTMGAGIDVKDWASNFWTFAVLVPVRGDDVDDYKFYLQNNNIGIKRDLKPVAFSLGYRIGIRKK